MATTAQRRLPPPPEAAPKLHRIPEQPDRYVTLEQPVPVAADLPAGTYWIGLGIYDPATFARLPLRGPIPPAAPSDGPNALLIGPMMLA